MNRFTKRCRAYRVGDLTIQKDGILVQLPHNLIPYGGDGLKSRCVRNIKHGSMEEIVLCLQNNYL